MDGRDSEWIKTARVSSLSEFHMTCVEKLSVKEWSRFSECSTDDNPSMSASEISSMVLISRMYNPIWRDERRKHKNSDVLVLPGITV